MSRGEELSGKTIEIRTGCGKAFITYNYKDDKLYEVIYSMGKTGGCHNATTEALGRLVSLALQNDIPINKVMKQIREIRCQLPAHYMGNQIMSCPDAIAKGYDMINEPDIKEPEINLNKTLPPDERVYDKELG